MSTVKIHHTDISNIPESNIINYVNSQQLEYNSLVETFDYNGNHMNIIPFVDLWLGMKVSLNPLITGGTITINGTTYKLSTINEQDGNTYWRGSVEPGQFNMYNIQSVSLNITYSSTPVIPYYMTYGQVIKDTTVSTISQEFTYAFNKIVIDHNINTSLLGITHSFDGCNTILYDNGQLRYDIYTMDQFIGNIYNIAFATYYKYANEYYDFIYNNTLRAPVFLRELDVQKSRGITYEVFRNLIKQSSLPIKHFIDNKPACRVDVYKSGDVLLGLSVKDNPNILAVDIIIDGQTYECNKKEESWYEQDNVLNTNTFWRISKEPFLFMYCSNSVINYNILFNNNAFRDPVIITYGVFRYNNTLTKDIADIYLTSLSPYEIKYHDNHIIVNSGNSVGNITLNQLPFDMKVNIYNYMYA